MQLHHCNATWRETVPVREVFGGHIIWQGEVEVFDLAEHPRAKRCYGWSQSDEDEEDGGRLVTVLEIPPVGSALTAVRVSIIADSHKRRNPGLK
jgi:hypothetical protein